VLNLGRPYLAKTSVPLQMKQIFLLSELHPIRYDWKHGLCHFHGVDMLKDICIISNDDDFLLTPHKNKGKEPGVTKFFISKTTIVYNMLPRRSQKSLPKLKQPTTLWFPDYCKPIYYKSTMKFNGFE